MMDYNFIGRKLSTHTYFQGGLIKFEGPCVRPTA